MGQPENGVRPSAHGLHLEPSLAGAPSSKRGWERGSQVCGRERDTAARGPSQSLLQLLTKNVTQQNSPKAWLLRSPLITHEDGNMGCPGKRLSGRPGTRTVGFLQREDRKQGRILKAAHHTDFFSTDSSKMSSVKEHEVREGLQQPDGAFLSARRLPAPLQEDG